MNGLVGYGSSSEDEDDVKPPTTATFGPSASHASATASDATDGAGKTMNGVSMPEVTEVRTEILQGPVVGPVRPEGEALPDFYEDDNDQELPPMPERDLLRYLTQPTHPMASFPPEPNSAASPAVTARFERFLELKYKGVHFNEDLADKTSFKNPNLFASLLERTSLQSRAQYSSVLSPDIFSIDKFPEWAYKEKLSTSQQTISVELEARKKAQTSTGKRTIEFTPAGQSDAKDRLSTSENLTKRKRT